MTDEESLSTLLVMLVDGDEPTVFERLRSQGMGDVDLLALAHRVLAGRKQYGVLRLLDDKRDFRAEARAEALDLAFYSACAEIVEAWR